MASPSYPHSTSYTKTQKWLEDQAQLWNLDGLTINQQLSLENQFDNDYDYDYDYDYEYSSTITTTTITTTQPKAQPETQTEQKGKDNKNTKSKLNSSNQEQKTLRDSSFLDSVKNIYNNIFSTSKFSSTTTTLPTPTPTPTQQSIPTSHTTPRTKTNNTRTNQKWAQWNPYIDTYCTGQMLDFEIWEDEYGRTIGLN